MKVGWKTTEFWITALSIVGVVIGTAATSLSPKYGAIAISISTAAYAISRGLAKMFPPKGA